MNDDEAVQAPPAKRHRTELLELYYAKLETLFKTRQRKEVKLKELDRYDTQCFFRATEKEIKNNLETNAYVMLSLADSERIRQEKPDRIMESRYVRTAKPLEPADVDKAVMEGTKLSDKHGGPCKAKVRHVMKGFSEDGAEELDAATPQETREGVMFTAQVIASKRWSMGFLDFTQAFHSGDPINRELYAEQPHEGIPGMCKGQLLRLVKTCYGLLDGPMAWFRHLQRVMTEELGYVQSVADPCLYFLHGKTGHGWDRLEGIVSIATDDMLHGGNGRHQEKMNQLNEKYKLGKFVYGEGRFAGKQFTPQSDAGILVDQKHYVKEKVNKIEIAKTRKAQRYSCCTDLEISQLRSLIGALSWLAKETRADLAGRVALLQQSFPRPRVRDMLLANQLAKEAEDFNIGIRISPIEPAKLRVSVVTDASWGNSNEATSSEDNSKDYWVETKDHWVRHHVQPRRTLFHPGMTQQGPDIHHLEPGRETRLRREAGEEEIHKDEWNKNKGIQLESNGTWQGQTYFKKSATVLAADKISEGFLQNQRTNSQGGHIVIFHDSDLQYEPSAMISLTSWKSYRLKRKVVNTLAAECQALVAGVGNAHWHRFIMLEAQGEAIKDQDWEEHVARIPYLAITDSKSLFDTLSKQNCPYSQVEDKRTAIDISIVKQELKGSGTVRWIDGRNMISDSLTKNTGGSFLRFVMARGQWTLNELGFTKLYKQLEQAPNECLFLFGGLWKGWFSQQSLGPM